MRNLRAFWTDETGATAIEYGLIAALLFLGVSGAILQWGESFKNLYAFLGDKISAAMAN